MSDKSTIEWTDATWNPTTGCTRVSAGCDHCYIETTPPFRMQGRRFDKPGIGGKTGVQLHPDRLDQPLRWRKPRRVFVNSLSDLFHPDVPERFIGQVMSVIRRSPQHTFQVLTKRPRRTRDLLSRWWSTDPRAWGEYEHDTPPPNLWLGVSVENQEWADKRIPLLLETPAAVRFLSCEPLLGPVHLRDEWLGDIRDRAGHHGHRAFIKDERNCATEFIHWVIVGGESGLGARPMHPDWARSLRDQCVATGVAFFMKQMGELWSRESGFGRTHGSDWNQWDADLRVREMPDAG